MVTDTMKRMAEAVLDGDEAAAYALADCVSETLRSNDVTLWVLRPQEKYVELGQRRATELEPNPWEPWYDCVFGVVVAARSEEEARLLANGNRGREQEDFLNVWLDVEYTSCTQLTALTKSAVVLEDVHWA